MTSNSPKQNTKYSTTDPNKHHHSSSSTSRPSRAPGASVNAPGASQAPPSSSHYGPSGTAQPSASMKPPSTSRYGSSRPAVSIAPRPSSSTAPSQPTRPSGSTPPKTATKHSQAPSSQTNIEHAPFRTQKLEIIKENDSRAPPSKYSSQVPQQSTIQEATGYSQIQNTSHLNALASSVLCDSRAHVGSQLNRDPTGQASAMHNSTPRKVTRKATAFPTSSRAANTTLKREPTRSAFRSIAPNASRAPGNIMTNLKDIRMATRQVEYNDLNAIEQRTQTKWLTENVLNNKNMTPCPDGFGWERIEDDPAKGRTSDGYQCVGGSHVITDHQIAENMGGIWFIPWGNPSPNARSASGREAGIKSRLAASRSRWSDDQLPGYIPNPHPRGNTDFRWGPFYPGSRYPKVWFFCGQVDEILTGHTEMRTVGNQVSTKTKMENWVINGRTCPISLNDGRNAYGKDFNDTKAFEECRKDWEFVDKDFTYIATVPLD